MPLAADLSAINASSLTVKAFLDMQDDNLPKLVVCQSLSVMQGVTYEQFAWFVRQSEEQISMVILEANAHQLLLPTDDGWVQSYGSRCVKPPIVIGDVSRPAPITVEWAKYAQSLTDKPVKGMLTGPVTILCWSFPREDVSRETIAKQIALALRDEVADLEAAGIGIS